MSETLDSFLARAQLFMDRFEASLASGLEEPDWAASIAFKYRRPGSNNKAGKLIPVKHLGLISLDSLREIDTQKERIARNTAQFVSGLPANNVLLTGARGTGKSSLVKACLEAYAPQGLRLIEMDKVELLDLPEVVDLVAKRPEKFIVFCDDLSFEEAEPGYKALKSVLDGSIAAATSNVLIYATSNRRHLLPEYVKENESYSHSENGEVHPGEVIEEKISLSERFGLWVSFYPFSQDEYLAIVQQWLSILSPVSVRSTTWRAEALIWAMERGSRSGRVAWQFARDFAGLVATNSS